MIAQIWFLAALSFFCSAQLNYSYAQQSAPPSPAEKASAESSDNNNSPSEGGGTSSGSPIRFWLGAGPTLVTALKKNFGARISLGVDSYLDRSRNFILGMIVDKPFTGEEVDGRYTGAVHRTYFTPNIGYYVVPQTIWGRIGVGLGHLSGSNPDITAKLKPTYYFEIGAKQNFAKKWDAGVSLSFQYSGEAKKSIAFIIDDISCAFGDCNATGTIPKAAIWSLNALVGYHL